VTSADEQFCAVVNMKTFHFSGTVQKLNKNRSCIIYCFASVTMLHFSQAIRTKISQLVTTKMPGNHQSFDLGLFDEIYLQFVVSAL